MASILSADITFSLGALELGLQGYLGGAGFTGSANVDGFPWSFANAVGWGVSIKWDPDSKGEER